MGLLVFGGEEEVVGGVEVTDDEVGAPVAVQVAGGGAGRGKGGGEGPGAQLREVGLLAVGCVLPLGIGFLGCLGGPIVGGEG